MARIRLGAAAAIASILVGCAGAPAVRNVSAPLRAEPPSEPAAPAIAPAPAQRTGLFLFVEPADAEIAIDGRPKGLASDLGETGLVPLAPGIYQVTVSRPGYATWRAEVAVRTDPQRFDVVLEKRQ